jgi:hypothetical protein
LLAVALVASLALPTHALLPAAAAPDGVRFRHRELYRTVSEPAALAMADLTGDGLDDVAMTARPDQRTDPPTGKHELLVFEQGPVGVFGVPERHPVSGGIELGVDAADVTADGRADVVVATGSGLNVFVQRPEGGLGEPRLIPDVEDAEYVAIADFDTDGWGDIAVQSREGIYVLRNDGGSFVEIPVSPLPMRDIQVAEVTGDDRLDILSMDGPAVQVFEQIAEHTFVPGPAYEGRYQGETTNPLQGWAFSVGDVSDDGRADIALVIDQGGTTDATTLNLFRQNESGGFPEPTTKRIATAAWSVAIADVDRSGAKDVIVAHGHDLGVGVLLSTRSGVANENLYRIPTTQGSDRGVAPARLGGSTLGIVNAAESKGLSILRNPVGASALVRTRAREMTPTMDSGYLAWSRARTGRPRATDAYVRSDGRVRKVNRVGTEGWVGGIDGGRLAYQEIDGRDSDIRFYNLSNGARSAPRQVNTPRGWEFAPSLSGRHLLYGSIDTYGTTRVLLRDSKLPGTYPLAEVYGFNAEALPGQVNGDYAVWSECKRICNVFSYRISEYNKNRIPNPLERLQYAPAVASDGTIFYATSGFGCGRNVRFVMRVPGNPPRTLFSLPRGIDALNSYLGRDARGREVLVFDRVVCRTWQWDIYRR